MGAPTWLPHLNGALNAVIAALLVAGYAAIRTGRRRLHPRLMLAAFAVGLVFLGTYATQVLLAGHQRFPGDDWVRVVFLLILGGHTLLAIVVAPLVLRAIYLAARGRLDEHRRVARIGLPLWLVVALSGVVIYWMNNHLRPLTSG